MLPTSSRRSSDRFHAIVLCTLPLLSLVGCGERDAPGVAAAAGEPEAIVVTTATVVKQPVTRFIRVSGTLAAQEEAEVAAEVAGRVVATPIERGSRIASGATLIQIADADVAAQAREADANAAQIEARLGTGANGDFDVERVPEVANARANYDLTRTEFERTKMLQERQLVSKSEFDQKQAQVEAARRQYEVARNGGASGCATRRDRRARCRGSLQRVQRGQVSTGVRSPQGQVSTVSGRYGWRGTTVATGCVYSLRMKLVELVDTSRRVSETSSRLEKVAALAELLRRAPPEEVEIAVAFLSGSTRQGRIGIGWSAIKAARPESVADAASLELREVDGAFGAIAAIAGAGSSRERARALRDLFARATNDEQDFLFRLLIGELRQGALEGVLLDAVARAANIGSATVRRATMMAGDLGAVARAALEHGEPGLAAFSVRLFQPVQPMLADTAETIDQAMDSLGEAALEYKMDGARIQVHKAGDDVRVFTRNLRDVTAAAPEIVEAVGALSGRELILDGEVIALAADSVPHPFQVTMRRFGRKLDLAKIRDELPLSPFFFDCLYLDGQAMIDEPQSRRFAALADLVPGSLIIPHTVARTAVEAEAFLRGALDRGHEGVMAKARGSGYAAGRRGAAWLKLKVARTLDLVVLAAEWGHGRRTGWLSNLHLGARDPDRNSFVMLGKTFKGMTDQMLEWQTEKLLGLELTRDDYTVYVRPELVVEVAFNDVQASPVYPGGLALRFARIKRYRTDKAAADADTFQTVQRLHRSGSNP